MSAPVELSDPNLMLQTYVAFLGNNGDSAPVGVRAIVPPADTRQAERGQLYAVVELAGSNAEREQMTEQLLSIVQRTYYTSKGKQSTVLSEAVQQALFTLNEFNNQHPQAPLVGGIICAGLLRQRLMLVSAGQAFAIVNAGRRIETFPPALPVHPIGVPGSMDEPPEVFRWELTDGDAIFLGSSEWERAVSFRILAGTVAYMDAENRFDAASGLIEQSKITPPPGLLIVVESDERRNDSLKNDSLKSTYQKEDWSPTHVTKSATNETTNETLAARRSGIDGLPTSLGGKPPVRAPRESMRADSARWSSGADEPVAGASSASTHPSFEAESREIETEKIETKSVRQSPSSTQPGGSTKSRLEAPLDTMGKFFKEMLPVKQPTGMSVENSPAAQPSKDDTAGYQTSRVNSIPDSAMPASPPFTPPAPARGGRARLFIMLGLLIPLVVAAIVVASVLRNGAEQRAQAEQLLQMSQASITAAQTALDVNDKATSLQALTDARNALDSREAILVGPDPESAQLRLQIDRISQQVLKVQLLYGLVSPLVTFPADARPQRVLVADQDIFILDGGRQLVQRFKLDSTLEMVVDPKGEVVMKQDDKVDGLQIGGLLDITWQPPTPGIEDKSHLLVLDSNNNVFSYNEIDGLTAIPLGGRETIKSIRQLKAYSGRIYAADITNNQIYRYQPGQYGLAPTPWFAESAQVQLNGLRSLRIDGNIWLLYENSQVLRFFNGQQVSFALDQSIGAVQEPIDFAVSEQDTGNVYLADRAGERVVVFKKDGSYVSQLRAPEGNPLKNLSAIFVEDVNGSLYLLTDSALFKHPLPQ